jgi:hypothetical protein
MENIIVCQQKFPLEAGKKAGTVRGKGISVTKSPNKKSPRTYFILSYPSESVVSSIGHINI